jgi:hypothetical protein
VNQPGEIVCDRCAIAYPGTLVDFQRGSRLCDCGGELSWYPSDEAERDEWEAW